MLKNQSDTHSLSTSRLVFILFAGTLIRFLFGYLLKPWLEAPDQLAWGLSIDEMVASGNFNYTQLMHNAFESGSWVTGLLSIPFRSIANILPALSWSASVNSCGKAQIYSLASRALAFIEPLALNSFFSTVFQSV